jgi:lysophospholipase L1-like esterase
LSRTNALVLLISTTLTFLVVEMAYRILAPFPYYPPQVTAKTEHFVVSQYCPLRGWRGIPHIDTDFYITERKTRVQHNSLGFRDIEHPTDSKKEALVFLGDSFTWGFGVNSAEMFVNILRRMQKQNEIYNLAYPGYGTDQELLTFKFANFPQKMTKVVLIISENDLDDIILPVNNQKPKPYFVLNAHNLILKNVPVPEVKFPEYWGDTPPGKTTRENIKTILFQSHFLHEVYQRLYNLRNQPAAGNNAHGESSTKLQNLKFYQQQLSRDILAELKKDVETRGATLFVVTVPSKKQFLKNYSYAPYQQHWQTICHDLGIPFLDLATAIQPYGTRAYYRIDNHWNPLGHRIAAKAILEFLNTKELSN